MGRLFFLFVCLFSPTPTVEWMKMGEQLPSRAKKVNFGKLLSVAHVSEEDVGKYMCKARNTHGEVVHYFDVIVEGTMLLWQDRGQGIVARGFESQPKGCGFEPRLQSTCRSSWTRCQTTARSSMTCF